VSREIVIDAVGLLCPQPVLQLAGAARAHPGALITVLADDAAAATDIPAWCRMRHAELVSVEQMGAVNRFVVRAPSPGQGRG